MSTETQKAYAREYMRKRRKKLGQNFGRTAEQNRMYTRKSAGVDLFTITRSTPIRCEVCGAPPSKVRNGVALHCDHDHSNGKFRGWLCSACNHLLGWMERIPNFSERVDALLEYKERESSNNAGIILTRKEFNDLHYD